MPLFLLPPLPPTAFFLHRCYLSNWNNISTHAVTNGETWADVVNRMSSSFILLTCHHDTATSLPYTPDIAPSSTVS